MKDDSKNVVDMDGMRVDDDHLLSMYIDGELDAERTIALAGRLKVEPSLRARLSAMENNDRLIKKIFIGQSNEHEQEVAALVRAENVVTLKRGARWREWTTGAIAASVIAAAALSLIIQQPSEFNPMTMDVRLAQALEHSPSRASGWEVLDEDRDFRSVLTFPAADGRWCREFLLAHDESHWRGVACRDKGTWVNQVVGSEVFLEQETQYRPAGAGDTEKVARFIDDTAADVALGPQQEAALIASGW
ncbi:MAG: hypothetical protein VW806_09200 [Halieaceae bacterium]|jgi:hypothetical protein